MPLSIPRFFCLLAGPLALACSAAWSAGTGEAGTAAPMPPRGIQVIELPPSAASLPGASRQRAHHALGFSTEAPKPFLRSLGIDASECSMRLRVPSRLSQSREGAAGVKFDLQLQAGLGCKF